VHIREGPGLSKDTPPWNLRQGGPLPSSFTVSIEAGSPWTIGPRTRAGFQNPNEGVRCINSSWSCGGQPIPRRSSVSGASGLSRSPSECPGGAPGSSPTIQLVHEFLFDDLEALRHAMTSSEGQQAGRALMSFAADSSELFFAEHLEMEFPDRGPDPSRTIPS
jgi:hypothetical protein